MLVFLKLGGSLITDKSLPRTARQDVIGRLAAEVAQARRERPDLALVLGHGSGSFGHVEAQRYGTARGVSTPAEWRGMAEVWRVADLLNRIVIDVFAEAGIPVMRFSPSSGGMGQSGRVVALPSEPLRMALEGGLVPVVYGDVMLDQERGGMIASTEASFAYLAARLEPHRILLAGLERGVYSDFPRGRTVIPVLTRRDWDTLRGQVGGSVNADVTGGMASKVEGMLDLMGSLPGLRAFIYSGESAGATRRALLGEELEGTWIRD
ncbi:MAG: isopentenyl phosphate kinase [Chloroflexi bacterium]|nr:isopentenyl phosphate kinase [Chloroflexota bacterium]